MNTIKGVRISKGFCKNRVYLNGKQLSWKKSMEYIRIGKTGFEWGYRGAGPQQLAFALLLELTNEKVAYALCPTFTDEFIANLPREENFEVPIETVMKAIKKASRQPHSPEYIPHEEKYKKSYRN